MEKLSNCVLCGSPRSTEIKPTGKWRLVKCLDCDLVYLNPRPSYSEIGGFYPSDYDRHWVLEDYLNKSNDRVRYFYKGIASAYASSNANFWKKFIFAIFRDNIGGLPSYRKNGRILDVGCADGFFLYLMKELRWQTKGVEPNQEATRRANNKGLDVFVGNLCEANLADDSFDVVRLWHVLEHTLNPQETLKEAYRVMRPGGEMILGLPNINAISRKIFCDYNKWYEVWNLPLHLFFYPRKTLKLLLEKSGFKEIAIKTHSGGSMRMGLEKVLKISLYKNRWLRLPWNAIFLITDFLIDRTYWADCLEVRCIK